MSRRRLSATSMAGLVCLAVSLGGCSSGEAAAIDPSPTAPADMTPAALAAAVAARLPGVTLVAAHQDEGGAADEEDALRVGLTFRADDGRRSTITVVATDDVGDFPGRRPCQAHRDVLDGCVETSGPDDTTSILLWQNRAPEDPGIIDVVSVRQEAVAWAEYDGKVDVTADPRDLDLPLSPEDLLAAVSDPSVGLTASPEQLRAGDELEAWRV
jgi:hypothetical protein